MSTDPDPPGHDEEVAFKRRRRARNLTTLAVLMGFVILVYVISIVRMGGN